MGYLKWLWNKHAIEIVVIIIVALGILTVYLTSQKIEPYGTYSTYGFFAFIGIIVFKVGLFLIKDSIAMYHESLKQRKYYND